MCPQIKELIAVGSSIVANCPPCLEYHAAKARENGASADDVSAAIAVGKTVRKGAAAKMDEFAGAVEGSPTVAASGSDKDCDCSEI